MPMQRIEFPGADGQILAARLDMPSGEPRAYALFAHCFTCGKDIRAASRIAAALTECGIGTLRFDFTGLGSSEGEFANTGFSSNVSDVLAAARFMCESGRPVSILIGHSLGGTAVLAAAGEIRECRAVGVIGAPFDPAHVLDQFGDCVEDIEHRGEAEVSLAGRSFRIRRAFVEDARGQDPGQRLRTLRRPLLVLHSPVDSVVNVDNARLIFEHALHPKSYVSMDDADHLLSRSEDAAYAAQVIAAWASRYLPSRSHAEESAEEPPGVVVVEEESADSFTQRIRIGRHRLLADEPRAAGGRDEGPGPYEYLLSALGACTSMTLRMYARHKGLSLSNVRVILSHEKIHAQDCEHCESRNGRLDRIMRRITLEGEITHEQRDRLMEIADKCPVHLSLQREVEIKTIRD